MLDQIKSIADIWFHATNSWTCEIESLWPWFSHLCFPDLHPYRNLAGQPICPCHSEQNHSNLQWLHCPHQTWLSHPWTIPVPFIKNLTTGPSQELQEGSVDGQIEAERRVGCCCRSTAGLRIRGCTEKWMQIKQTLTSLPDSVEPPVGAWGSNLAKVKKIIYWRIAGHKASYHVIQTLLLNTFPFLYPCCGLYLQTCHP